jgi:RNA polymerase sigma-70 factor (ECF subfamily)
LTTSDSSLLERAREFDKQALAEIYDTYAEAIYRYLYRYLGDAGQAEDLTSDVFLKLLDVLGTRRAPREQLQGWLYRVAHNLAMDFFRREAKRPTVPLNEELVATDELPIITVDKRMEQQRLRTAIGRLTSAQQQVILLRFGEGFKVAKVARLMGKSEGAVKVLQHRAIRRLQKVLEAQEPERARS